MPRKKKPKAERPKAPAAEPPDPKPAPARAAGPRLKKRTVLTLEEIRFCHHYFAGEHRANATQSYLAAGFPARKSVAAVGFAAHELLKKPKILAYLATLERDASEAEMVTTRGIVRGFKWAAEADVAEVMTPAGEFLPYPQWPDHVRAAVSRFEAEEVYELSPDPADASRKVRVFKGVKVKVWLENKTENRKVLAQIMRMIGPDDEVKGMLKTVVAQAEQIRELTERIDRDKARRTENPEGGHRRPPETAGGA